MEKQRLNYIDISKGIGIFSVVLVHLSVEYTAIRQVPLAYCVAMFFIISGFLFSGNKNPREFVLSIIQKMLMPFLMYQIIDMIYTLINYLIKAGSEIQLKEIAKIIIKVTYVTGSANSNGPLWFLISLIYVEIIFYLLLRMKNRYILHIAAILMFAVGFFIRRKLLFRVGQIPSSFVLFYLGYNSKNILTRLNESRIKWICFPVSLILFLILCYLNGYSGLSAMNYGKSYALYYIEVCMGTVAVLSISMIIGKSILLEFLGRNSLTIMCCHYYIAYFFIPYLFRSLGSESLLENYFVEIILAVAVTALMMPVCIFVNKKLPVLTGRYNYKFLDKFKVL